MKTQALIAAVAGTLSSDALAAEVAKGMVALRHRPSSGEPSVRVIDVQLCKYTFFKNPLSVFPDI